MEKQLKNISKLMSLVLRHEPEYIGLSLDAEGWTTTDDLIDKMNKKGIHVDFEMIQKVVETNDKKRFAFNEDKTKIRANQGHSIEVELNLQQMLPPEILYHGTAHKYLEVILKEGLKKQQRHHVHLSAEKATALSVGSRHGKPIILEINTLEMLRDGHVFYISDNDVWLVDHVPPRYLIISP